MNLDAAFWSVQFNDRAVETAGTEPQHSQAEEACDAQHFGVAAALPLEQAAASVADKTTPTNAKMAIGSMPALRHGWIITEPHKKERSSLSQLRESYLNGSRWQAENNRNEVANRHAPNNPVLGDRLHPRYTDANRAAG
jgi:hypothetical protein